MIQYLSPQNLEVKSDLKTQMHSDRSKQFKDRLGWDVLVDADGLEFDEYDFKSPTYVILTDKNGNHVASLRLAPTFSGTMVHDHFSDLDPDHKFVRPTIFECTRLCLSYRVSDARVLPSLLTAATYMMAGIGISHFISLVDERMARLYRRFPGTPELISSRSNGSQSVFLALWKFSEPQFAQLRQLSLYSEEEHQRAMNLFDGADQLRQDLHNQLLTNIPTKKQKAAA